MNTDISLENDRLHIGSFFIALGTVLLCIGYDEALGIANNYTMFAAAILCNMIEFLTGNEKRIRLSPLFVFSMVLIVILDVIHMAFSSFSRAAVLSIIFYLILILSVVLDSYSFRDAGVIADGVIISSMVFTFLTMFLGRELYPGAGKYVYVQPFGEHVIIEPNYLGALLTLGFCLSVYHLMGPLRVIHSIPAKFFYIVSACIILLGIMLTGSRSALVSIFFFAAAGIIFMENSPLKRRLFMLAAAGVAALLLMLILGIIPQNVVSRMFNLSSYIDASNMKRIRDWLYGLRMMIRRPLLGSGPELTQELLMNYFGFSGDAHNTFITAGIMYGLPVLALCIYYIASLTIKAYRNRDTVMAAIMIAMIFEWNIIACQFTVSTWLTFIICMIMVNTKEVVKESHTVASGNTGISA